MSRLFATFFYTGYFPIAPGTFASFVAVILWVIMPWNSLLFRIILILVIVIAGIITANRVERESGFKDPGFIVIDEVAGMWLTLLALHSYRPLNILQLVIGFLLFRFFDITKTYPIKRIEAIGGGPGIMLDDIMAGIYAGISLYLINLFLL